MLVRDIAPAYGGGNIFRARRVAMVKIGQRAGHLQNTVKTPCTQFFGIGDAVEQILSARIRRGKLIKRFAFRMLVQAVLPTRLCRPRTFAVFGHRFIGQAYFCKGVWPGAKCALTFTETASTPKNAAVLICATMPPPTLFIFVRYASNLYIFPYFRNINLPHTVNCVA